MLVLDSSTKAGRIAEASFLYVCSLRGWGISMPLLTPLAYDFAVYRSEETGWEKVQVKYAGWQSNKNDFVADVRSRNKKYQKGQFDYLFVYSPSHENFRPQAWFIPFEAIEGKSDFKPANEEYDMYRILWEEADSGGTENV